MLFFQIPKLPEALLKRHHWNLLVANIRRTSRPGTFSKEDFFIYREAWQQEGAMTAMLNWYRALVREPNLISKSTRISQPTLILWGAKDFALGLELAKASVKMCDQGRLVVFEEAGHWVQHEEPERVYKHLTTHFGVFYK